MLTAACGCGANQLRSCALPSPQSDLARDILKDPYTFDFLGITDTSNEHTVEKALVLRLRDFLIELGVGFAFVGSQYRLEVDGDEFFMDLLFYHTRLHCHVVIEFKNTAFRPEYVGKLNFYLAAVDEPVATLPTSPLSHCSAEKTCSMPRQGCLWTGFRWCARGCQRLP
jgi:hypothetical protein